MLKKWLLLKKIALSKPRFTMADMIVALILLDHYNDKQQRIFPTNRRLVKLTGLSLRQVQLSTAKLSNRKLITKLSKFGKNHYEITPDDYQNYEQPYTSTTKKPAPPTKPISLTYNIKDLAKRLAKNTNANYKATVNNGLGYHKNMENKYIKLMTRRLAPDRYHEWLLLLNDKNTKQRAIEYAKELCG